MSDTSKRRGRRTVARHGRLAAPNVFARLMQWVAVAAACVLVAGVGVAGYAAWDFSSTFAADAVELDGQETSPPDIGALLNDQGVNLLLTGIDVCEWDSHERFGDRCPSSREAYGKDGRQLNDGLNDVNLLVHVSPEPRRITAVAFPRDMMIPTPECTDTEGNVTYASDKKMINTAYAAGGLNCVAKTIDSLTTPHDPDLAVDYAATVTWNGVIEITNAVGGVEVCVDGTIDDREAGMLYLEAGKHTLAGEKALAFLRSRHGVGDGGDQARISNQQVYMSSLARKLMSSEVLSNPGTVLSLARTVVNNVDPSARLTPVELVRIALAAKDVKPEDIVFLQYPTLTDPDNPNRLVPNTEEAAALFTALAENKPISPTGKYLEEKEQEAPPAQTDPPADAAQPTQPTQPTAPTQPETPGTTPTNEPSAPDVLGRTAADTSCSQANN